MTGTFDNEQLSEVRLDRWLFAVRIFKSRSLAARAVSSGKIKLNGDAVKPHRGVKRGDFVTLKREGQTLRYDVLGLIEKRVGAAPAKTLFKLTENPDLNPETREMMKLMREMEKHLPKPKGRPTKRDRRQLERFQNQEN